MKRISAKDSPQALLSQHRTVISKAEVIDNTKKGETKEDRDLISEIFRRLQSACPAWKQSLSGLPADEAQAVFNQTKRDWLNAFMENGINDIRLINYAFSRLLSNKNPFMPTVAEFIEWCREGNLPDGTKGCLESYKEVLGYIALPLESRKLSGLNPEVYHTLHNLDDFYRWRHAHEKKSREIWYSEHNKTLDALRNGEALEPSPVERAKLEDKRKPIPKNEAISRIQAMRASLKKPKQEE